MIQGGTQFISDMSERKGNRKIPERQRKIEKSMPSAKGRRCSPLPPESSSGNSCILKDMFGTNVAYRTVQFNTTAPKVFYSTIID
ncbi:hypothetical protein GIB67_013503, partial [Kingdonia uniflora]